MDQPPPDRDRTNCLVRVCFCLAWSEWVDVLWRVHQCGSAVVAKLRAHVRCCCLAFRQVHFAPQGDADEDALREPVLRRVPFPPTDASRGGYDVRLLRLCPVSALALRDPFLGPDAIYFGESLPLSRMKKKVWRTPRAVHSIKPGQNFIRVLLPASDSKTTEWQMLVCPTKHSLLVVSNGR